MPTLFTVWFITRNVHREFSTYLHRNYCRKWVKFATLKNKKEKKNTKTIITFKTFQAICLYAETLILKDLEPKGVSAPSFKLLHGVDGPFGPPPVLLLKHSFYVPLKHFIFPHCFPFYEPKIISDEVIGIKIMGTRGHVLPLLNWG